MIAVRVVALSIDARTPKPARNVQFPPPPPGGGGTTPSSPAVAPNCPWISSGLGDARLLPPAGRRLGGFSLDWMVDTPTSVAGRVGFVPSVNGAFVHITTNTTFEKSMIAWYADQVRLAGKSQGQVATLSIALMSDLELSGVADALWDEVADEMRRVNYEVGVPIFLRFAHEMNGNWLPYGQRPIAFQRAWRRLTSAVRQRTNLTAMVWAPNMGAGYPFSTTQYSPANGTDEFKALDTNGDGELTNKDDPYLPFWPGRDWVDWVGISIYWFGPGDTPSNTLPPTDYIFTIAHGNSSFNAANTTFDFYAKYALNESRPMMLPESGALFYYADPKGVKVDAGVGELAMKREFWTQAWAAKGSLAGMNMVRAVLHFEEAKLESRGNGTFRVTSDPTIRAAFLADVAEDLKRGPAGLTYYCNGTVGSV
ncbi:glycoside hydrolase family 26 protein [Gonapodya prolifera JEL478]|uniref:Glycoside hydrolase family 26 protein n=1 Tax=Gonapodya prolifera (strain JEL478) TaxID=1344416 RepID=A0A139AVY2_GONPJ|nr:glycoside hydrolase family 26 protein [Gonapodya prolifera JEL478]|eukprot:KXS20743.1 glycoside hydrolase family 26 protein [Gonapodya prolifera JEL478]